MYFDGLQKPSFGDDLTNQSDIDFEADPRSLARILENRELSPSATAFMFRSSLTPAVKLHQSLKKNTKDFEYFEGKNGAVFCRTKVNVPFAPRSAEKNDRRKFGKILQGVLPIRTRSTENSVEKQSNLRTGPRTMASEKKIVPFPHLTHRQSISERKPIPGIDKGFMSRVPKFNGARKGLDFNDKQKQAQQPKAVGEATRGISHKSAKSTTAKSLEDSFDFPKPLPVEPEPVSSADDVVCSGQQKRSIAELIMMRESLAGFPRESFSVLFRQSLSGAELERMFEDDSTGNFEKLELRLKTPKRPTLQKSLIKLIHASVASSEQSDKTDKKDMVEQIISPAKEENLEHCLNVAIQNNFPTIPDSVLSDPESCLINPEVNLGPVQEKEGEEGSNQNDEANVELEGKYNENWVSYTEEDLKNIEIIEYEFEDPDMSIKDLSIFDRSLSLADLKESAFEEVGGEQKCLPRSISFSNLNDPENEERSEDLWQYHLDELKRCRQEQAEIERKLQSLMLESLTRKEQFRQVWGVSPKSINQKRNLKTLIGAHQISFTEQEDVDCETTLSKADKIDYEMFESDDVEKGMFDRENIEKENGGSQEIDVEGLLPLPDLNFSIPTELFSQYIDANFPANEGDNLIISTQFQSIEDVFSSQPLKANVSGNSPCLEPTTSYSDTCPEAVSSEDAELAQHYEEDEAKFETNCDLDDTYEVEDMELESEHGLEDDQVPDLNSQASCSEFLNPIFKTPLEAEKDPELSPEKVKIVTQSSDQLDVRSLIAAAKMFKKEEKRPSKSVRFITPKKSDVVMYKGESDLKENKNSTNWDDKLQDSSAYITVNIPVNIGKTRGNISFNESGVFSHDGMVHTPVPKHSKFRMSTQMSDIKSDDESDENVQSQILPTPMALRDISNKAQQSLASLYSDSPDKIRQSLSNLYSDSPDSDGQSADVSMCLSAKKLFEDEDGDDITN